MYIALFFRREGKAVLDWYRYSMLSYQYWGQHCIARGFFGTWGGQPWHDSLNPRKINGNNCLFAMENADWNRLATFEWALNIYWWCWSTSKESAMLHFYVFTAVQNQQTKMAVEKGFHVFSDPNRFSYSNLTASCHKILKTGPLMGHDLRFFLDYLETGAIGFNWSDSIILVSVTKLKSNTRTCI